MPTAVLMMIGQIEVMKITKIADGRLSRNAASAIGSQASGGTVRSTWKIGSRPRIAQTDWPTRAPSSTPTTAARPKPIATRCSEVRMRQPRPMSCGTGDEERIDDQVFRIGPDTRRRRQRRPGLHAENLPEDQKRSDRDDRRDQRGCPFLRGRDQPRLNEAGARRRQRHDRCRCCRGRCCDGYRVGFHVLLKCNSHL